MGEKISAVVLAAGAGRRMNSEIPKQYMPVANKPLVVYSLEIFDRSAVDEIVLVVAAGDEQFCQKEIVDKYNIGKVTSIVAGGAERYDSVYAGLKAVTGDYVLIHDCARAFVTNDVIDNAILNVKRHKACVIAVPSKDTVKIADENGYVANTPKRDQVWSVQTPQCFEYALIKEAYDKMQELNLENITDDAMVVEQVMGRKVKLVMGDYNNVKVTTPEDIGLALNILKSQGRI
ncbi:MAG: 2-C-methyl-D-erythritol 4-phosphate cytidylyltransferase [Lachnospiraceae bacterium]|nr:2-C-methyl-D-erythritol 4-phosphate cytidylyltransferase [Lachnospiraceae bacterium]